MKSAIFTKLELVVAGEKRWGAVRGDEPSGREVHDGGGDELTGFVRVVDSLKSAFQAKNQLALDTYVRSLLDPPFAIRTSKALRAANIDAANFFENAGDYDSETLAESFGFARGSFICL